MIQLLNYSVIQRFNTLIYYPTYRVPILLPLLWESLPAAGRGWGEVGRRAKRRGFFLLHDDSTKSGDWGLLTGDLSTITQFNNWHSSTIIKIYHQKLAVVKYVIYLWKRKTNFLLY